MATTLEQFAAECRTITNPGRPFRAAADLHEARAAAAATRAFIEASLNDATPERQVVYEDPALGFCVLAHSCKGGPKDSPPHDHGPSWAIYGQAKGETEMTDYELVAAAAEEQKPGKARPVRTYKLTPGTAYTYNEGDLHSPRRRGPTRLIRIEGLNMDRIKRLKFEVVA